NHYMLWLTPIIPCPNHNTSSELLLQRVSSCLDSYQNCILNPYGYGKHIHARRWKHIKDWLSFVGTYRL
ncbi:hypothetical protein VYH83_10075, partial [Streptococcus anginosus]